MIRGTTPNLEFTLPFDTDIIKELYITFAQNSTVVIEKTIEDCACNGDCLSLKFTQKDTLSLKHGVVVEIQIRLKTVNGEALASDIIKTSVSRILKDGEI